MDSDAEAVFAAVNERLARVSTAEIIHI
jgi:hypothetical protein